MGIRFAYFTLIFFIIAVELEIFGFPCPGLLVGCLAGCFFVQQLMRYRISRCTFRCYPVANPLQKLKIIADKTLQLIFARSFSYINFHKSPCSCVLDNSWSPSKVTYLGHMELSRNRKKMQSLNFHAVWEQKLQQLQFHLLGISTQMEDFGAKETSQIIST